VRVAVGWCDLPWRPDVALYTRKYYRRLSSRAYYHGRSAYNPAACAKALSLDRMPGHSSSEKSTAEHRGILTAHASTGPYGARGVLATAKLVRKGTRQGARCGGVLLTLDPLPYAQHRGPRPPHEANQAHDLIPRPSEFRFSLSAGPRKPRSGMSYWAAWIVMKPCRYAKPRPPIESDI
jgi:hypothetical protein